MIHNVVSIISFIIWLFYYFFLVNREIARKNKIKDQYNVSLLKNNIFYLFRLDNLFFLLAFYIYKGFNNASVTIYLYFVFVFASLVFILYDIFDKYDLRKNKLKKEKYYYLGSFLLILIPLIYYLKKHNIANTAYLTLVIDFLVPVVIFIISFIIKAIKNKR